MTASMHGGRGATVARASATQAARAHLISVSPHIRSDGAKHPNAFEARFAGEVKCVSEAPLLDAARALLAQGIAHRDDTIVDALRARIGVAAGLAIEDRPSGAPGLRLGKYRQRCTGRPRIAQRPSRLPTQPAADRSLPGACRAAGRAKGAA